MLKLNVKFEFFGGRGDLKFMISLLMALIITAPEGSFNQTSPSLKLIRHNHKELTFITVSALCLLGLNHTKWKLNERTWNAKTKIPSFI